MAKVSLTEVFDAAADGSVPFMCPEHFYFPSRVSRPAKGCVKCWKAFYFTLYAKTPEDEREDFVNGMEMVVTKMVEHDKKGTWDFKPERPVITIEKE